jgi:outer membrane protein assembly factor BamD (BamD/ComL family)
MGRKRARTGKYIYLFVASLTSLFLFVFSCATLLKDNEHLLRSQKFLAKGDYEGALEENQKVLSKYANTSPGDEALFNMGLIYAHYGNPKKDYKKALSSFWKLINEFPQSPRVEEAKIWIGVLNVIEETKMKIEAQRLVHEYFPHSQKLLAKGDYEGALEENQKVLSKYANTSPGDEALFNMGLIYAHYGNPKKDYKKSISFFQKIVEGFPKSPLTEQAKIWIEVLQVIEKSKQVDIEIEEMKKELSK